MLLLASFINPGFVVAGMLLAAIPLVIHFLNRRRYTIVPWAAMEFLLRAMKQNRRRLRFESWLLLATRCLVLALLGLALARPMGCSDNSLAALAGRRTGLHVIVIDNSCSMAYQADRPNAKTQLDQAKIIADELIDRLSSGGETVSIITSAKPARLVTASPLYDLQAAKAAVDRIAQTYTNADLPGALEAAEKVARSATDQPNRSLDLIDDSTRSKWSGVAADGLASAGKSLSAIFQITHFDLSRPNESNQSVVSVRPASSLTRIGFPNDFLAVVRGYGSNPPTALRWSIDDQALSDPQTIQPQPDTAPITRSDTSLQVGGPHVISVTLAGDDRLPIDNTARRVVNAASELKVLIVEGDRGSGPLDGSGAFLQLALSPPAGAAGLQNKSSSYISSELISDLELPGRVLQDNAVVVLANVAQVSPEQADQLGEYVKQGGALLIFMGEGINADAYNQTLLPRRLMPGPLIKRIGDPGSQKAFQFDFNPNGNLDPILRAFAGEENSGLETAQIFSYWQVDLPANSTARRILNYQSANGNADPAVTIQDLGNGRVVFFSTSAGAQWTTLPAKPAYVTFMHELVAGAIRSSDSWMNLSTGESLTLPASLQLTTPPTMTDPQQREVTMQPPTSDRAVYQSAPLQMPGVYRLRTGSQMLPIAVNIPEGCADVRNVSAVEMKKSLGGIDCAMLGDALPPADAVATAGNDLGWSVMVAVMLFLGAECLLALRFGQYRRT